MGTLPKPPKVTINTKRDEEVINDRTGVHGAQRPEARKTSCFRRLENGTAAEKATERLKGLLHFRKWQQGGNWEERFQVRGMVSNGIITAAQAGCGLAVTGTGVELATAPAPSSSG